MKDSNCIFCKIANGEIPSSTIYEDEDFRVILDLGPASRGHAPVSYTHLWGELGDFVRGLVGGGRDREEE